MVFTVYDNSYTVPLKPDFPTPATNPSPDDLSINIATNTLIEWDAGDDAVSHDVYFGTTTPPPFVANQSGTIYNPGTMLDGQTYYLRIDEVNSTGTTTGSVWSFTTKPPVVSAFYLSPTGNDASDGSFATPWKTINKANNSLSAGDTVYLRGGTYLDEMIEPYNSGTSDANRITYKAYPGEIPLFKSTNGNNNSSPIILVNKNYITVDGIHADGEGLYENSKWDHWCWFDNSSYCTLINLNMTECQGYSALEYLNGSHHNKVLDSILDGVGDWNKFPYNGEYDDTGRMFFIRDGCNNNLIEGNDFSRGGHDLGSIDGDYNVIRNNIFDNTFEIYSGLRLFVKNKVLVTENDDPTGDIESGDPVGNRALALKQFSKHNLVEGNLFKNIAEAVDDRFVGQMKVGGISNIVRKNYFRNGTTEGHAFTSSTGSDAINATKNKIFHNSIYSCYGGAWKVNNNSEIYDEPRENIFKNNIVYKTHQNSPEQNREFTFNSKLYERFGDNFAACEISFNCVAFDATASFQVISSGLGTKTLSWSETNYPSYFHDNVQADPNWVSSTPVQPADFNLDTGSPCINAGGDLTTANGAGASSITLIVDDADYFQDGFGIITADSIQVGANSPVLITSINYVTKTITLASAITWSDGDGVNLPYSGSAPDIGANQT